MDITLRPVTGDDCDLLFRWANDRIVRQNAFSSREIDYQEHVDWFEAKLSSGKTRIYICIYREQPVGQIRVDLEGDTGVISYSVAEGFRGKGIGTEMLRMVPYTIRCEFNGIRVLAGKVKRDNAGSCRAFEKAGYHPEEKDKYIEYIMEI